MEEEKVAVDPLNDLFCSPTEAWTSLDPNYLKVRRIWVLVFWPTLLIAIALGLGLMWRSWWPAIVCGIVAIPWIGLMYWREGRLFRARGFAERETDLYVKEGLLIRQLTIIPYGRMQVIQVNAGPISRAFGVASVELVTAGPSATIPGLNAKEAVALRDRLSLRGQQQQAGL